MGRMQGCNLYYYQVGQQIWLDEHNFLSKNQKLAPNWTGPFVFTKIRDNSNIIIKLNRKEINVNVNRLVQAAKLLQTTRLGI